MVFHIEVCHGQALHLLLVILFQSLPLPWKSLNSSDLMEMIVEQSSEYTKQVMGDEKFDQWNKMTVVELKAFLGFLILMAINHLPALDDYWKRDPLMHYAPVADRISRERFCDLCRYLHFMDNHTLVPRGSPGYDRLGKVPTSHQPCDREVC